MADANGVLLAVHVMCVNLTVSWNCLQPQLAPLLGALLPAAQSKGRRRAAASQAATGSGDAAAKQFVAGPLARLPPPCQVCSPDHIRTRSSALTASTQHRTWGYKPMI